MRSEDVMEHDHQDRSLWYRFQIAADYDSMDSQFFELSFQGACPRVRGEWESPDLSFPRKRESSI